MLDAAVKALSQMFSPPFRTVLWKSVGLALVLIVIIGIAVQRLLVWLATYGMDWAEGLLGTSAHTPLSILAWVVSIAVSLGIIVGSIFLMPAVTALVGTFFVDDIALEVERTYYPADPLGSPPPPLRAARRCADGFVLDPGLSRRGAVPPRRRSGLGHFFWPRLICSGANISSWRPCATARGGSQAFAQRAAARSLWPACSSPPSYRYRSSISPRHCSPWRSWCTCTSEWRTIRDGSWITVTIGTPRRRRCVAPVTCSPALSR
jgi:hypothetical protein